MITFNNTMLKNFIEQNYDFLFNARIQKIQQPKRKEIILSLRNNGQTKKLYINIDPKFYHICFMNKENESKRLIEIPQKPPMFCMLLRKYLEGAKISKIAQPEYERILEIYIESYNELSEKIYLCLAIELMGKHSNVILYNYDTNIILGCAHNVGEDKSKEREVIGGLPYTYPKHNTNYWLETKNLDIDNYYANIIANEKFKSFKGKYKQVITRKIKKTQTSLLKLSQHLKSQSEIDKYRLYGDLIMSNLYNNKDFTDIIEVYDYQNNKNIIIDIDKTKTLKDNANNFYKLYNKTKTSHQKSEEMITKIQQEKEYLEQILYSIEISETISELQEIAFEIEENKKNNKPLQKQLTPAISANNYTIWIGKNNKQNDYIVSKIAKDDDMWFHTHNCAGSHVLLRAKTITNDLIIKCANLAKENSSVSESSKIGVIYTYAKYLKKPPKANLGYVTYSQEKEIIID